MTTDQYDKAWDELNARLNRLDGSGASLEPALCELERQQKQARFIHDELYEIERFRFTRGDNLLLAQLNPRRRKRFEKPVLTVPPTGMASVNNGCVLCRDNIRWQQHGLEIGYDITLMGRPFTVLMNPFPLLPCHVTIVSADHLSQEWEFHAHGTLSLEHLLTDLVELGQRLPGLVGFYNGVGAGASIPEHRHYQFGRRPVDTDRFPLELAPRDFSQFGDTGIVRGYPLAVALWQGSADTVIVRALHWIRTWAERNQAQLPHLGANLVVTSEPDTGDITLYFAPRDRRRARSSHLSGIAGGLEVMGEVVLSSEAERQAVENGQLDYDALLRIYNDIHTPLFTD